LGHFFNKVGDRTEKKRSPWFPFRKEIKKIVFSGYIGNKGLFNFRTCCYENLYSVEFERCLQINYAFHGYDYVDLWNMDDWFCWQFPRMLQELKKKTLVDLSAGMGEIIDRMIYCFTEMRPLLFENFDEEKIARRKELEDEGFKLFREYFHDLGW
jgi:hypothetical protein